MNVLSLFDGMVQVASSLERCGFKVENYFASETINTQSKSKQLSGHGI